MKTIYAVQVVERRRGFNQITKTKTNLIQNRYILSKDFNNYSSYCKTKLREKFNSWNIIKIGLTVEDVQTDETFTRPHIQLLNN